MHDNVDDVFEVKKVISSGYIIKINGNNVLINTRDHYQLFDEIKINGNITTPVNSINSKFDFVAYLKTLNVKNVINYPHINLVSHSDDIRVRSFAYLLSGPDDYKKIAPLIMLGIKTDESKEIYQMSIRLSIVHLFVISGFHISFFYLLIQKIFKFIKWDKYTNPWIPLMIIFIYLFLINFTLSATRAFLLILFISLSNKILKEKISSLGVLAFVMGLMFIWKPYAITSLSFIFTFLATSVVLYINSLKIKHQLIKYLLMSLCVYLMLLPVSIYVNHFFAPMGVLMGVVFAPTIIFAYILSIFLFPFKDLMNLIYLALIWLLTIMDKVNPLITINLNLLNIQILYLIMLTSFIIGRIWYSFMAKSNFLLKKN